jgi:hypothetical protein
MKINESKKAFIWTAYTTRNPPASENGDYIVVRPIARPLLHTILKTILSIYARGLGSGLIDQSQKATAAAIQIADK